jgi:Asp-tRNA(Asn)/Glu-tRNA(Gln) amidotransferase C subunit
MSQISSDDVRKVAHLARLDLPEDKIATYTGQLESILEYVSQLQQVDTEGVPGNHPSCGGDQRHPGRWSATDPRSGGHPQPGTAKGG